jgi:polyphenol oxidase
MSRPEPTGQFEWTQAPWGAVLRCRPLLDVAEHFFTAAPLQLKGREAEWDAVAALAGVPPDRLRLLHQVHGTRVVTSGKDGDRPEADGIVTEDPSVAVVVRVADCAPILIADRRLGVVAAVHAGWRSTMQRIAPEAVAALKERFGSRADDLVAAIGPSLGACCGEMGGEVVEMFRGAGHDEAVIERWFVREAGRKPRFGLWRANREQLERAGVPPDAIHVAGLCTRTHPEVFHSYRAAGQQAGRMAAVIRAPFPSPRNPYQP